MEHSRASIVGVTVLAVCLTAPSVRAHDHEHDRSPLSVIVSFGAGLNTAGPDNHHVLPPVIRVKAGGVVNFAVAGLHQIFVYFPGKTPDDVVVPPSGMTIDDLDGLFYAGISPVGPPPTGFSNDQNRVEPVAFPDPGTYLVICNIRSHFLNGMYAYVTVEAPE